VNTRGQLYLCLHPYCDAAFSTAQSLNVHVQTHFHDLATQASNDFGPGLNQGGTPTSANAIQNDTIRSTTMSSIIFRKDVSAIISSSSLELKDQFIEVTDRARSTCPKCSRTFGRPSDLERHAKKYQTSSKTFQCPVPGCKYGGSYRKDKVQSHLRNRHPRSVQQG
jgi:uncharacterized Zn-finger protein